MNELCKDLLTEKGPNYLSPWTVTYKSVLVCQRNLTLSTSVKTLYNTERMPTNQHSSKWNSLNFLKPCLRFTESNQDPTWSIFPTKLEKHYLIPFQFHCSSLIALSSQSHTLFLYCFNSFITGLHTPDSSYLMQPPCSC